MTANEYLKKVLASQNLAEDSEKLQTLRDRRDAVETLLRDQYGSVPTIRYGGSYAKGTLIKELYDLDLICHFPHDDESAGNTLAEIYANVATTLEKEYLVQRKTSALRLQGAGVTDLGLDFHIDVVPGRYVDDSNSDCFIYQNAAERQRLKTNLAIHIKHIRNSGVVDAIRLLKLWRIRRGIDLKQFVFELLVIDILKNAKSSSLSDQLKLFWTTIDEVQEPLSVEDPANPEGNDLSGILNSWVWSLLRSAARTTLDQIENDGWESVYGPVENEEDDSSSRVARIQGAAAAVVRPTRPWASDVE